MPNEPLLTRKSYKEQLEKQQRELEVEEFRGEHREGPLKDELGLNVEEETSAAQVQRTPKSGLRKYNHFLNIWLVSVVVLLIIVLAIQMFF